MLSQMLSAAWRPHRLTTVRAPGHTLHHGPRAICAKRAKYGEISRQSGKEGKKTGAKVPPACGVATSGRRCDRRHIYSFFINLYMGVGNALLCNAGLSVSH